MINDLPYVYNIEVLPYKIKAIVNVHVVMQTCDIKSCRAGCHDHRASDEKSTIRNY